MKRPIHYCKSWFRAKKRPTELWPVGKAEAAHLHRRPYTALVGSADRPYCFVDVTANVVVVGFLDSLLRESLTYAFKEIEAGTLFMTMAVHRDFEADTDSVTGGVTYIFDRSGTMRIRREYFRPHRAETATSSFDPAPLYDMRPEFGQYDDITRVERQ